MISDTIMARISSLMSVAPKFATHAGLVSEDNVSIQSNTSNLISTMGSVPELASFNASLDAVGQNLKTVMQCHADALMRTNQGLVTTAQTYQSVDSALSHMMSSLATNIQGYSGYETPVTSGTPQIIPPVIGGQPPTTVPVIGGGLWTWLTTHG